jgi:hypothetical protein
MLKRILAISLLSFGIGSTAHADGLSHLPLLSDVAPDAVAISPHVPNMGVHWANPADLPNGGPIYCEIEGRVVCLEYIFPADAINGGNDFTGLPAGIETPPITHIDWEYKADGVGGNPTPVYQLHIYFADPSVLGSH